MRIHREAVYMAAVQLRVRRYTGAPTLTDQQAVKMAMDLAIETDRQFDKLEQEQSAQEEHRGGCQGHA